ncbi:MAG: DNA-protecting protein DprA, partial [Verrucomicrobiota bacterium]
MLEPLLALNALPKIGPVRIRRLLDHFGNAESVLKAGKDRLMRVDGIGPELAEILLNASSLTDPVAELNEV